MEKPIVFFGSGPVAAASLELLAKDFSIEAVVTKPQPPHHKEPFPVLELAEKFGLRTLTPSNKGELSKLFAGKPVSSKLGVVIDYGIIISQDVIDYFPLGIVNSHFSLLPEWRGADPITFSILSGQKQTGVSLMLIDEKLDEGPLLSQATYNISPATTTPELTKELIDLSDQALKQVLPLYVAGEIQPAPQEAATMATSKTPSYSRKLTKDNGQIDWQKPAIQLEREIRAFIDWPKSHVKLRETEVIITKARVADEDLKPGEIQTEGKKLIIGTAKDSLEILALKPAGKPEMPAEAFLAGYNLR